MIENYPTQARCGKPRDTPPSLTSPTRETLVKCHKSELQKRCQELGLNKIWVRKDQLIDMILQASTTDDLVTQTQYLAKPPPTPATHDAACPPDITAEPHPQITHPPALSDALNEVLKSPVTSVHQSSYNTHTYVCSDSVNSLFIASIV
ncbi:hypothetical protein E2C01_054079 [Portunus trituberculatus]|uniref:Uncharacterized protein n=1 Tax=Portunus trituberculatus TaxID=210409 RepID=A0A5B7GU02_PORTR|nr:hypothetical protein [Portunus trituberculatus]